MNKLLFIAALVGLPLGALLCRLPWEWVGPALLGVGVVVFLFGMNSGEQYPEEAKKYLDD